MGPEAVAILVRYFCFIMIFPYLQFENEHPQVFSEATKHMEICSEGTCLCVKRVQIFQEIHQRNVLVILY